MRIKLFYILVIPPRPVRSRSREAQHYRFPKFGAFFGSILKNIFDIPIVAHSATANSQAARRSHDAMVVSICFQKRTYCFLERGTTANTPFWGVRIVLVTRVREVVLETLCFESIEDHT